MKTFITIIMILTTIIIIVACTYHGSIITEVVVIRDITDKHLAQPNANEILALFKLENKWNGGVFQFTDLTNVSYNRVTEAKLEARNEWLSNELDRDKEIKNFQSDVSEIITTNAKVTIGKDNSSVYAPIAQELNRLSQSPSQNKTLLIYSDLMENTDEMSFYDKRKLDLLKTNPDSIRKYFEAEVSFDSLQGIKIYFIFQPNGLKEDEQYKIALGFYKKWFEAKGAIVEIGANLN